MHLRFHCRLWFRRMDIKMIFLIWGLSIFLDQIIVSLDMPINTLNKNCDINSCSFKELNMKMRPMIFWLYYWFFLQCSYSASSHLTMDQATKKEQTVCSEFATATVTLQVYKSRIMNCLDGCWRSDFRRRILETIRQNSFMVFNLFTWKNQVQNSQH